MRIFIGTTEIGGQIPLLAAGFRALGHEVTTGVHVGHCYKFDTTLVYDMQVNLSDHAQAARIIDAHDVFLFQFGQSLLRGNTDYRLIKRAGKKIISLFNGSDIRYWPLYERQFGVDYRTLSGEELPAYWSPETLPAVMGTLRRGEMYADLILSVPNQSVLAVRPYNHFFYAADIARYRFNVPAREVPVVVHAPSKMQTKGTARILAALDALKAEGVAFDLRLLHDVSNAEVLDALVDADCVIDQIYLGYGFFATEAMASGCAAATGHFSQQEAFATLRPTHPLHIQNLVEDMRKLLTNRDLRVRLAHEGRAHVETFHNNVCVCRRILEGLDAGEGGVHDYYPRYYACEGVLPEGVHIAQKYLKMTSDVVARYGLPQDADPVDMTLRGLLTPQALARDIPRWNANVHDCSSLGGLPILKSTACLCTASVTQRVLPLLESVHRLNLVQLCLDEVMPLNMKLALDRELSLVGGEACMLALDQFIEDKGQQYPACQAALGFLLLGTGQRQGAAHMLRDAVANEASDKKDAIISVWVPLARWLAGVEFLECADMRTAVPLLEAALEEMSCRSAPTEASITRDPNMPLNTVLLTVAGVPTVPDSATLVVSWARPTHMPQGCGWVSPATFAPDWWAMPHSTPLWPLVMFLALCQGYTVLPVQGGGRTAALLHSLAAAHNTTREAVV